MLRCSQCGREIKEKQDYCKLFLQEDTIYFHENCVDDYLDDLKELMNATKTRKF